MYKFGVEQYITLMDMEISEQTLFSQEQKQESLSDVQQQIRDKHIAKNDQGTIRHKSRL